MSCNSVSHVLHEFVNNYVVMSEDTRKANVKIIERVKKELVDKMRKVDDLFDAIYDGIYGAGSYYDKLKVRDADEFDLNVLLRLPFGEHSRTYFGNYKIDRNNRKSGYAQYKLRAPLSSTLNSRSDPQNKYKDLPDLFDDKGILLSTEKMNRWWQSVVDRALAALHEDPNWHPRRRGLQQIRRACHGPATTLTLVKNNEDEISLDLVPVIPLHHSVSDFIQNNRMFKFIPSNDKRGFLVPKSPPQSTSTNLDSDAWNNTFFRVSIPQAERLLMTNMGIAKTLIRIFKALRDLEKWDFLPSYYIKVLFLWKISKNPATWYWSAARMEDLFVMMLMTFQKAMKQKRISNIPFPEHNLLENIDDADAAKVINRLDDIIDMVNNDRLDELAEVFPGESDSDDEDYDSDDYPY